MSELTVRAMTPAEFVTFRAETIRGYSAENVEAGNWTPDEAEERATKATNSLLPQGLETPGVLLLKAENSDGVDIGHVWVALERSPGSGLGAWIYDIRIKAEHQGNGYGRALLRAAEKETAKHGVRAMGLNVFGSNLVARSLYESAGYSITSMHMHKELPPYI